MITDLRKWCKNIIIFTLSWLHNYVKGHKLATSQENLSSGFPTKCDSNQPAQLENLNFTHSKSRYDTLL